MKTCTACGSTKPFSEFHKSNRSTGARKSRGGGGVEAVCKFCKAERRKPGINANRDRVRAESLNGQKTCSVCQTCKPVSAFTIRKASPDGLSYKCGDCYRTYKAQWDEKNPSAYEDWYEENRERKAQTYRLWRERNKDRLTQNYAAWAKANKHIVNALIAKRMAAKFLATPSWANQSAIREFYKEASRLTELTGIRHEVDHIYPLQGEFVCGLHCEGNLQILTKAENIRKKNHMPDDPRLRRAA